MATWIEELTPFFGDPLFEALRAGCRETWLPSISWVLEKRREILASAERIRRREEKNCAFEMQNATKSDAKTAAEFFQRMRKELGLAASDRPIGQIDVPVVGDDELPF